MSPDPILPATQDFSECEPILDDRSLRQGDVFAWLGPDAAKPWTRLGIVVTADCDIVLDKHEGIISYVPLLALHDYLRLFYLPQQVEKANKPATDQLVAAIRDMQRRFQPQFPAPLSPEAALEWTERELPDAVADALGVPHTDQRTRFVAQLAEHRSIREAMNSDQFADHVGALLALRCRGGSEKEKAVETEKLRADIASKIARLPGDCFFVGRVDADHAGGFVAYLRLVRELKGKNIAIRQKELRNEGVTAKRIAKLASPFVYRLTQQLGDVFASIGLPSEYENCRKATVATLELSAQNGQPKGEGKA